MTSCLYCTVSKYLCSQSAYFLVLLPFLVIFSSPLPHSTQVLKNISNLCMVHLQGWKSSCIQTSLKYSSVPPEVLAFWTSLNAKICIRVSCFQPFGCDTLSINHDYQLDKSCYLRFSFPEHIIKDKQWSGSLLKIGLLIVR